MTILVIFTFRQTGYLWDLSWARSSVISTCPTSKIEFLIALKNLQYTSDMLMIYLFLLIILTKSTYYKTPSKKLILNFTHELNKNNKISFLDILIDNDNYNNFTTSTYKKKPLIITPVPSTLKVNVPSDIKKQLLITWYPVPNWSPPPKQYFIKR